MATTTTAFSGELGLLSLFDLGQLLALNRATGSLAVGSQGRRAFLFFNLGKLVNAVDDAMLEGEAAAYRVLQWREGTFEFRTGPPSGTETIEAGTESVLLEAARQLDEAMLANGADAPSGEAARLVERQAALEALREVFQRVAGESRGVVEIDSGLPLDALVAPGDCLAIEPGRPARLRTNGRWADVKGPALTSASFAGLRERLLEACSPSDEVFGASAPRLLPLPGGRTIAVERIESAMSEALWLRPALLPPPDPIRVAGDPDRMTEIVRLARGLVIAGGPDLDSARALLYAFGSLLAVRRPAITLVVSNDPTYDLKPAGAPSFRTTPDGLPDRMRALQPGLVVLDPAIPMGAVRIEDLETAPRILAGAVASTLPALATRLVSRLTEGDTQRAQFALSVIPIGLVLATPTGDDGDALPCIARLLSDQQRIAVLRGDPAALVGQFGSA